MSLNFFEKLIPATTTLNPSRCCVPVPNDWFLVITDIKNSTEAIQAGKYREVNIVGALCIMSIMNSDYYRKIPFIFGGDGVMFLIPKEALALFTDLMHAVREFARNVLNLELRIGIVPITTLYQADKALAVGKLAFGHGGCLAIFEDNGIDFAESLVKMPDSKYLLTDNHFSQTSVNFTGFFCPFADIPSEQGHVMALIIKPLRLEWQQISTELFQHIGDESLHHPLDVNTLKINSASTNVDLNASIISGKNSGLKYHWQRFKVNNKISRLAHHTPQEKITHAVQTNMIPASDYRKYDGSYKIVFRCNPETVETVIGWLSYQEQRGNFLFGYHLTNRSIMTCLFDGKGDDRELHLIDAADGGYALAAVMLKRKLKS